MKQWTCGLYPKPWSCAPDFAAFDFLSVILTVDTTQGTWMLHFTVLSITLDFGLVEKG